MRLNRRKNRGSESRPKRASDDAPKSSSEGAEGNEDKPQRSLARSVREMRSEKGTEFETRSAEEEREERRAARKSRRERAGSKGEGAPRRGRKQRKARKEGEERKEGQARKRPRIRLRGKREGGKPRERRKRGESAAERRAKLVRAAKAVAVDLLGIARELLRWPARIWMTVAEALGKVILAAWVRGVLPAWRMLLRALRVALAFGERTVTPARGLAVVALAATITLGASQFGNYRAVEVGKPAYTNVEDVAQPPQVAQDDSRSAHGAWVFAIAVVSLFATAFAVWRNYRLARLLLFLGLAVVAISLFTDRPQGLHLGTIGEAYAGAQAVLLGPFWVQLFSGVTLAVVGPLLALQLRAERAVRPGRAGRRHERAKSRKLPRLRPGVGT
jgi:hypothetical protein